MIEWRWKRQNSASIRAFTLIELTAILLIIAILSAVVITQMPDIQGMRITQAAYKIQSDIRYAQRLAMQLQRRVAIVFRANTSPSYIPVDSYSIFIENTYSNPYDGSGWNLNVRAKNPLTQENFDVQLNSEEFEGVDITYVLFNSVNYALMFDRDGSPYGMQSTSPFTATALADDAGVILNTNRKYIVVKQGTGRINVQDTSP